MALSQEERTKLVEEFRINDKDTGSAQVQVAILTHDVRALTEHLKKHKKDYHTQRGLMKKVGRRNRLLRYLKRTEPAKHRELVKKLGLRG